MESETSMPIRKAVPADAGSITSILRGLGWFAYFDEESPAQTEDRVGRHLALCLADNSHSVYVATTATGAVVGYIAVHWQPSLFLPGPEGYISELFVEPEARGQGLGRQLLETVEEEALARTCCRLLLLNRRNRESYARGFYKQRGWVERPEAVNFIYPLP
jgi:GNAT superfamily N-acetyltransferase